MSLQSKLRVFAGNAPELWTDEKVNEFFRMMSERVKGLSFDQYEPGVREYLTNLSPSDEAVTDVMKYFENAVVDSGFASMSIHGEKFANNDFKSFKNYRNFAMELFDIAYRNLQLNHYDEKTLNSNIRFYTSILDQARTATTYKEEQSALKKAKNLRDSMEMDRQRYSNIPELPPIPSPRLSYDSDEYSYSSCTCS